MGGQLNQASFCHICTRDCLWPQHKVIYSLSGRKPTNAESRRRKAGDCCDRC